MKNKTSNVEGTPAVAVKRVVIPQPDSDFEALKVCCNAIETCSSLRMVDATLDFLNSKYRSPGAV